MNNSKLLSKEIDSEKLKSIGFYLLAFFIPMLVQIGIFFALKVYPFGENTYLPVDALGQYVSYLQYFRDLFLGESSIFYSLSKSIGGEMYGLFAYYLISPYNFITLFFEKGNMTLAFDIILTLKISTCGLSFAYYLNRKKKADFTNLIFVMLYAFSSYIITYGFNIMWLDSVMLLPFVIAGIEDLIQEKKILLYVVSLAITLITNYYMGFMVCVFSVIYFLYKLLYDECKNKKEALKKISIFAIASICAVLISSIIIIPAFIGLQNGRAEFSFSNINFEKNFEILNLTSKFFTNAFNLDEIQNNSMPPIFCGVFANVMVILYFFNKKIRIKEKILTFIVFAIFLISFYINGANLLWMMGNIPAWYEYRYTIFFAFFFINIAHNGFENIRNVEIWKIILSFIVYQIIAFFTSMQNVELLDKTSIKLDIILVLIFDILLILSKTDCKTNGFKLLDCIKRNYKKIILITIFLLSTANIINNAYYCMNIIRQEGSRTDQNAYSMLNNIYCRIINNLKEYDNSLYRIEKKDQISSNDPLILGYNGITYSASTYNKELHDLLGKLGIRKEHVHLEYNIENTKTFDMLLGIKYLIMNENYENKKNYDLEYEDLFIKNKINILKNPYYLQLAYMVNNSIFNIQIEDNSFENQNKILRNMTGINENVYKKHEGEIKRTITGLEDKTKDDKQEAYKKSDEESRIKYEFKAESEDNIYIYLKADSDNDARIYINEKDNGKNYSFAYDKILNVGKKEVGENVSFEIDLKGDIVIYGIYIYYEDDNILKKHYDVLSKEQANIEKINNSEYKVQITTQEDDKYLFLTLPYEEGWKTTVDGKEVQIEKALDTFMAIKIEKGEHEIELKYNPPKIQLSLCMSVVGILTLTTYEIITRKIHTKEKLNY